MQDDLRPVRPVKPAPTLKPTPDQHKIPEPTVPFQTPDQVSQHDIAGPIALEPTVIDAPADTPQKRRWSISWPPTKQQAYLLSLVVFMAAFGIFGLVKIMTSKPATPTVSVAPVKAALAKPTTVASALSGLPVAPELNDRPVVGVMIENSKAARPQSGLSDAGVVFEAIAEGGITRFLALYQDIQPANIGPIRSARPYYVQWNESFRAAYAHVGGSAESLANIKDWGVQDLNQFYNASAFRREASRTSPHNVYSNVASLADLATQKGYKSTFTSLERKKATPAKQPSATSIDMGISSALYNVHYDYDPTSNSYLRSQGGAAHTDTNTNKQLAPNTVIGLVVPMTSGARTGSGGSYSNYNPIGSGQAYIFQDGTVTVGSWHKASNTAQITFTDSAGASIKLNPGQTWMSAVTSVSKVTYK